MKAICLALIPPFVALLGAGCGNDQQPAKAPNEQAPAVESATAPAASSSTSELFADAGPTTMSATALAMDGGPSRSDTAPSLSDAEILKVTHTANAGEIAQAKLADTKTKDARVRKLAAMMVSDHSTADAKGKTLAKKDGLKPTESPTSQHLESDVSSATSMLKGETGATFDKDYVNTQVKEHQAVLSLLDQNLIPAATSDDMKQYLAEVRAKVAMHLEHARALASELEK
jgi:putative membrane protein